MKKLTFSNFLTDGRWEWKRTARPPTELAAITLATFKYELQESHQNFASKRKKVTNTEKYFYYFRNITVEIYLGL